MPHPQLWPAWVGAIGGFVLILWLSWQLFRRWNAMAPRRRTILLVALALFEAVYWLNVYAWLIEPNLLVVRRVEIVSARWHGAPLTIAAIGDTHVASPHVDVARIERVVRRVNALRPDLVVLLGDYVGGNAPRARRTAHEQLEVSGGIAAFAALDAPLGVVSVIGNHDVWYDRNAIAGALEDAGASPLWNRYVVIPRGRHDLVVAGLADHVTGPPRFADALDGALVGADTIVLSHSPDPFAKMPSGPALMLAAHSHCGQVTIPFIGRPILPIRNKNYACGLIEENGAALYVTAGIGTSIRPVRFLNPPEIVLITLRGAVEASDSLASPQSKLHPD